MGASERTHACVSIVFSRVPSVIPIRFVVLILEPEGLLSESYQQSFSTQVFVRCYNCISARSVSCQCLGLTCVHVYTPKYSAHSLFITEIKMLLNYFYFFYFLKDLLTNFRESKRASMRRGRGRGKGNLQQTPH